MPGRPSTVRSCPSPPVEEEARVSRPGACGFLVAALPLDQPTGTAMPVSILKVVVGPIEHDIRYDSQLARTYLESVDD